jgi:phosphoribosylformylglycinamidine synthase PurS subunit
MIKLSIYTTLKAGVLDPQAKAINNTLNSMGFREVSHMQMGKTFILDMDTDDESKAIRLGHKMCQSLLANTIMEDYTVTIVK